MEFARFDKCTNARLTLSSVLTAEHVYWTDLHIRKGTYKKKVLKVHCVPVFFEMSKDFVPGCNC